MLSISQLSPVLPFRNYAYMFNGLIYLPSATTIEGAKPIESDKSTGPV
jgi:hypothetical protein